MRRGTFIIIAVIATVAAAGCCKKSSLIEQIIIDYPNGETRLLIQRDGQATLFYGALPQKQMVRKGTFDIDDLYAHLQGKLHNTGPRENWPNPKAKFGMVWITYEGGKQEDYFIFEKEYSTHLFDKARRNVMMNDPSRY